MVATTPRVYVACLASYNAGKLHGRWIDADTMRDEIAAMLRDSPEPNVRVDCPDREYGHDECETCDGSKKVPSAEELAIHDYEGFEGIRIGEYESIDTVAALATAVEEHGEAFQDAYIGTFRSLEDWGEEFLDDTGMFSGVSDTLKTYFDFERYAEDCRLNGDIWSEDGGDGVYIFWNR